MKNLLIEGMPETGKSTLIGSCVDASGLRPFAAGYQTARVYGTDGKLRGFCHLPASEEQKINLYTDEPDLPLFMEPPSGQEPPVFHEEIFIGSVLRLLMPSEYSKYVLIDEMGGSELRLPEIRNAYLTALQGPLPALGVLKSPLHAKKFDYDAYLLFRKQIAEETETEMLSLTEENREEIRQRIENWIEEQKRI